LLRVPLGEGISAAHAYGKAGRHVALVAWVDCSAAFGGACAGNFERRGKVVLVVHWVVFWC